MTPRHTDTGLTPAMLQILLSLADEQRHGYGIMSEVRKRTGGSFNLGPGTLYRSISRMVDEGLIEESPASRARDDDERKRYYRLTRRGRRAMVEELGRLRAIVLQAAAKEVFPGGKA